MPNLTTVLKQEVARIARKEIRAQTSQLKRAASQYRRDIAALKREAARLQSEMAQIKKGKTVPAAISAPVDKDAKRIRYTAKGLRSQRKRLGFSAAQYAKLVGVTPQSIYNWERGVSSPRQGQLVTLAALRGIGKKEANALLGASAPATDDKEQAAEATATPKKRGRKKGSVKKAPAKKRGRKKAAAKKIAPKKAAPKKKAGRKKAGRKKAAAKKAS